MKILGLPGIKPATEQWLSSLLDSLELDQAKTSVQPYRYWSNPAGGMKMEMEAATASMAKPDMVIAKSIGTRVALYAFANGLLTAKKFIFIGIPLQSYSNDEITVLKKLCNSMTVLIIQQTDDPLAGFPDISSLIPETKSCRTIEIPGDDHQYGDIQMLKQIIESWYVSRWEH